MPFENFQVETQLNRNFPLSCECDENSMFHVLRFLVCSSQ